MDELRLRPAGPDDHPTFARLFLELGTDDAVPDRPRFEAQLMADTTIADLGGRPVGYAYAQALETTGYVRHLVVDPTARRLGVGRRILAELAGRFRAAGCTRWCLNVKPDNAAALALYESCGMRRLHATQVVRLAWGDEVRLPAAPCEVVVLSPGDEATFEDRFATPRGLLAARRASGQLALGARVDGEPAGIASFDPGFPGSFPFRAIDGGVARALIAACRERRAPIVDAEHRWREHGHQVVVEDDAALAAQLIALGGHLVLETLHYAGDLDRPGGG